MSTEKNAGGYGYASDEVKVSPFSFGLNAGKTFLKKFEWIPNGGKDGAEQEALDIVFEINGTEKGYRQFPVVKAFTKDNTEVTDPSSPEMKEAFTDFNAKIMHILHCYNDMDTIQATFSRPIKSFKEFCQIAMSLIPANAKEIPLDIFLQYQWTLRENQERTYLEIPAKMKYGRWLNVADTTKNWKAVKVDEPDTSDKKALTYVDEATGDVHPFVRNGWFMTSNFAKQQKSVEDEQQEEQTTSSAEGATTPPPAASGW